jgi:ParB family transcriptional regulator, chromosome partitioning protein
MQLVYLDPQQLEADPAGVREAPGDVAGLAETIREQGLLQPLGVVPLANGRYQVVYGNRRRAAALHLGLERVPCILLEEDESGRLLQQLTENVQRADLNDLEKARAFARLRASLAGRAEQKQPEAELDEATGRAVGLTGRTVRRYLGLLELPEEVQDLIRSGELSVTQAQHLRRIPNAKTQVELAREAVAEGMSASEIGRLAAYFAANPNLTLDTALQALQQGLELSTKIQEGGVGGGPLAKTSVSSVEVVERDTDYWDDEGGATESGQYLGVEDETLENQPKNKARVFRIRSLDQMVDETDRLSRAYAEGDLMKWVEKDEGAPFKLRLLLKQLDSLARGLREVARQQGWATEE